MGRLTRKRSSKAIASGSKEGETTPLQKLQKTESSVAESVAGSGLGIQEPITDGLTPAKGDGSFQTGCVSSPKTTVPKFKKNKKGQKNSLTTPKDGPNGEKTTEADPSAPRGDNSQKEATVTPRGDNADFGPGDGHSKQQRLDKDENEGVSDGKMAADDKKVTDDGLGGSNKDSLNEALSSATGSRQMEDAIQKTANESSGPLEEADEAIPAIISDKDNLTAADVKNRIVEKETEQGPSEGAISPNHLSKENAHESAALQPTEQPIRSPENGHENVDQSITSDPSDQPIRPSKCKDQPTVSTDPVDRPTTSSQSLDQPITSSGLVHQPTTSSQSIDQPITLSEPVNQPTTSSQSIDQPIISSDPVNQATTSYQSIDQPITSSEAVNQSEPTPSQSKEQPITSSVTEEQPIRDQPITSSDTEEQPIRDQPITLSQATEYPVTPVEDEGPSQPITSLQSTMEPITESQGFEQTIASANTEDALTGDQVNTTTDACEEGDVIEAPMAACKDQQIPNPEDIIKEKVLPNLSILSNKEHSLAGNPNVFVTQGSLPEKKSDTSQQASIRSEDRTSDESRPELESNISEVKEDKLEDLKSESESLDKVKIQAIKPSLDVPPADTSASSCQSGVSNGCPAPTGSVDEGMEDGDITDSQLCSVDWDMSDTGGSSHTGSTHTGSAHTGHSHSMAVQKSSAGDKPARVVSPGPVATSAPQPADGSKVVQGLIRELSSLNQTLTKTYREMEDVRKQQGKENSRPFK